MKEILRNIAIKASLFLMLIPAASAFQQSVSIVPSSEDAAKLCRHFNDQGCFAQAQDFRDMARNGVAKAGPEGTAQGAYARFQLVCERGMEQGCIYAVDTARGLLANKILEIRSYRTGCENGLAQFCGAGYMSTAYPKEPEYDRQAAEFFAQKGCSLSDENMCKQVVWQKENPDLGSSDAKKYSEQ